MIYQSPQMNDIAEQCRRIARKDKDVSFLLLGETGVGKNVLARYIHAETPARCNHPFIEASLSREDSLLDSELWGYGKGAFTGAYENHNGAFTRAAGGSVFLDEIGDLSAQGQFKLLKVVDERRYQPLGATDYLNADARIIAATNKPMECLMEGTSFRADLYHRLSAETVVIPPLRERPEDIIPLAEHFLCGWNQVHHTSYILSEADLSLLVPYSFPGNVRELKNVIESTARWSEEEFNTARLTKVLTPRDIAITLKPDYEHSPDSQGKSLSLREVCRKMEREHIRKVLIIANYNSSHAAHLLGISRSTLRSKMKTLGLGNPRDDLSSKTG